jgi:hypothetical protein
MENKLMKNLEFWAAMIIVILTAFLMFAYYNRWFSFAATIGPFRVIHYIAFAGTLYIAFGVLFFSMLKRRNPQKYKMLLRFHSFGNLIAFLLVSLHFAGQLGRPANSYPELGTGLALYIGMTLLVISGLALRFHIFRSVNPSTNRFIHAGLALAFYIVIIVHTLHGLNLI